jgi:ATP phosphoribosyltransferase
VLSERSWSAEVLKLSGSIELAPLLNLAELALDIVQTGRTLVENGLEELETVADVMPCLVAGRAAYQRHRPRINDLVHRLEQAGTVY